MRGDMELHDIILGEFCPLDFYNAVLPLAKKDHSEEQEMSLKFRCGTIEDYAKSLHTLLLHSSKVKLLLAFFQSRGSDIVLAKDGINIRQFVHLELAMRDKPGANYSPGDFVIMTKQNPDVPQDEHVVAAVDSYKHPKLIIKTILKATERDRRSLAFRENLQPNSEWHLRKLMNISYFLKEFESLHFIEDLPLIGFLLNQEELDFQPSIYQIPEELKTQLKALFPDSHQQSALNKALRRNGITIITGAPGSGKSEVASGVLASLLNVNDERHLLTPKKYTIEELLKEEESADYADDYMKDKKVAAQVRPWLFGKDSGLSHEDIRLEKKSVNYMKAIDTDNKIVLQKTGVEDYFN